MRFSDSVRSIPHVGKKYQKKLKKLQIKTVKDLLYHFPHRYEDFSDVVKTNEIKGEGEFCTKGKIAKLSTIRTKKKKMYLTEARIEDEEGEIRAIWFNQPYIEKNLDEGDHIFLAGKTSFRGRKLYFSNPSYEKVSPNPTHTGRLVPVYPETEGISSKWLRHIVQRALQKIQVEEFLPQEIIDDNNLLPLSKALNQIHFPDSKPKLNKAQERFSFEELFKLSLIVLSRKMSLLRKKSVSIPIKEEKIKSFVQSLPFELTQDQKKAAWRVLKDLNSERPMNRLLEGDVGSGKTVVAVIAALNVSFSNLQSAFMAPTEILAQQHFQEVSKLLKDYDIKIGLLTGKDEKLFHKKEKEIKRSKFLKKLKEGEIDIVIGTHTLIADKVEFNEVGFVILDEQHRFGVEQRAKLCKQENYVPHLLSMTATPIPRSLALTIYGDLDLTIIKEMPKGRKKIITKLVNPKERKETYNFIRNEAKKGHQTFVICPRIEAGEDDEDKKGDWNNVKTVKEEYNKLDNEIFPDLKVGIIHGQRKTKKKEKTMNKFKKGDLDILVSTSMIEVGIDVPNATIMVVEGAERFGLSQLHQFRGRVGRSEHQSYCFLLPTSKNVKGKERLKALVESEDGFELAERDLELRGPGDLTGFKQWGAPDLKMASLKDQEQVQKARESAKELIQKDPDLNSYPDLKEEIEKYDKKIHLE